MTSSIPPRVGDRAPDFTADTDTGERLTLSSLRGRPVVLYYYPKNDTAGCTTEACEFRDAFPRFDASGVAVLGVSPDPVRSHAKFRAKYALPFPFVADVDHAIADAYGVWQQKSMYGRTYMGVARTTFVLDRDGRVARVFERVKPAGHASEVASAVAEFG
ncbi:MAG TPA: thioredoxin-dependent thiol peroxidase [Gemmatirosa sp.]